MTQYRQNGPQKTLQRTKQFGANFVAPPSGKSKIRAENIPQIKGDADYHENINLQLLFIKPPIVMISGG